MAGLGDIADELESVARHLRQAGETELARELTAAMRRGVQPVPGLIRAGLDPHLPRRYAETLDADLRLGVNVRTTGSNPGASLTATTRSELERALEDVGEKAAGKGAW
jgi:hypothetical protein